MRRCVCVGGWGCATLFWTKWLACITRTRPHCRASRASPHWQQAPRPSITATADIVPKTSALSFLAKIPDLADTKAGRLLLCRVHRPVSGVCGRLLALKQRSGSTTTQRKGKHPLDGLFSNEKSSLSHKLIDWIHMLCQFLLFVICCFCLTLTVTPRRASSVKVCLSLLSHPVKEKWKIKQ